MVGTWKTPPFGGGGRTGAAASSQQQQPPAAHRYGHPPVPSLLHHHHHHHLNHAFAGGASGGGGVVGVPDPDCCGPLGVIDDDRGAADPSSNDEDSNSSEGGWIQWFCRLEGHEFFCEVDPEYIRDAFNLYGIRGRIEAFDQALEMVLGLEPPDEDDLMESETIEMHRDAVDLYGLTHARFILSPKGLSQMRQKYLKGRFGYCPRVGCNRQRALPIGISDELKVHRVRIYCPKCQECYDSRYLCAPRPLGLPVDGAYFGSSFPGIFLQTFPNLIPLSIPTPFVPRIFGFRLQGRKSLIEIKLHRGEYGLAIASGAPSDAATISATEGRNDQIISDYPQTDDGGALDNNTGNA